MEAELALGLLNTAIQGVLYIINRIKESYEDAKNIAEVLPVINASLHTLGELLQSVQANISEYLSTLKKQVDDAHSLLSRSESLIGKMEQSIKEKNQGKKLEKIRKKIKNDTWFFAHRSEVQGISSALETSQKRIMLLFEVIRNGRDYNPATQITNTAGRIFWQKFVGQRASVGWTEFFQYLQQYCEQNNPRRPLGGQSSEAVRRVIDVSNDRSITPVELNRFLAWFAPLETAAFREPAISTATSLGMLASESVDGSRYFCGGLMSDMATEMLEGLPDGAFLVRWSTAMPTNFAVSYRYDGQHRKSLIYNRGADGFCFDGIDSDQPSFQTITELISSRPDIYKWSAIELLKQWHATNEDARARLVLLNNEQVSTAALSRLNLAAGTTRIRRTSDDLLTDAPSQSGSPLVGRGPQGLSVDTQASASSSSLLSAPRGGEAASASTSPRPQSAQSGSSSASVRLSSPGSTVSPSASTTLASAGLSRSDGPRPFATPPPPLTPAVPEDSDEDDIALQKVLAPEEPVAINYRNFSPT